MFASVSPSVNLILNCFLKNIWSNIKEVSCLHFSYLQVGFIHLLFSEVLKIGIGLFSSDKRVNVISSPSLYT